ncbi:MAG: hypothetical protein ACK5LU_15785, partial [Pseudanabaena sp.]
VPPAKRAEQTSRFLVYLCLATYIRKVSMQPDPSAKHPLYRRGMVLSHHWLVSTSSERYS